MVRIRSRLTLPPPRLKRHLLLPLLHRERWADAHFRRGYLASLLVFVVIFNHQAERPSFVIAAAGVAIWFVQSPRDALRLALVLLSLTGLRAWGYLPVWAVMQGELHGLFATNASLIPRHRDRDEAGIAPAA